MLSLRDCPYEVLVPYTTKAKPHRICNYIFASVWKPAKLLGLNPTHTIFQILQQNSETLLTILVALFSPRERPSPMKISPIALKIFMSQHFWVLVHTLITLSSIGPNELMHNPMWPLVWWWWWLWQDLPRHILCSASWACSVQELLCCDVQCCRTSSAGHMWVMCIWIMVLVAGGWTEEKTAISRAT